MVALSITRTDLTSADLRAEAARSKNAIAMVLDGHSREAAAEACAMDRQTLRDWVLRYNEYGLPGLYDLAQPDPRPFLTAEQEAEVVTLVENGPDLVKDGVVRWRRVDLRDRNHSDGERHSKAFVTPGNPTRQRLRLTRTTSSRDHRLLDFPPAFPGAISEERGAPPATKGEIYEYLQF
jgi:transposase